MTLNSNPKELYLYSERSISLATYLGGPLAAGILLRRNFLNLGNEKNALWALLLGIISTAALFIAIFSIPETIIEKVPNALLPLIYTGVIYFFVHRLQGTQLKQHKDNGGVFYSAWRAAGIGLVYSVILIASIFGVGYIGFSDADTELYDAHLAEFSTNEENALELFDLLQTGSRQQVHTFIIETGIPNWQTNLDLLSEMSGIEGLDQVLLTQNELLREYCQLRIESYRLIDRAISEDSNSYDEEIDEIMIQINDILERL